MATFRYLAQPCFWSTLSNLLHEGAHIQIQLVQTEEASWIRGETSYICKRSQHSDNHSALHQEQSCFFNLK